MPAVAEELISQIEQAVRRDPARRGLLSESELPPLGLGELQRAAASMAAADPPNVIIVTGFYIPTGTPPAAETDGPPGSIALAQTVLRLGGHAAIVTDSPVAAALAATISAAGDPAPVFSICDSAESLRDLCEETPNLTHLIAIERLGPSYDEAAIRKRYSPEIAVCFCRTALPEVQGRCLSMRGHARDDWTVDYSPVFDNPPQNAVTISVFDGGNELGAARFSWADLAARFPPYSNPAILCRTAADHAILAGTSDWGAYALSAAVTVAMDRPELFSPITLSQQEAVLRRIIVGGPAVDGVTGLTELTVDCLPLATYLEPLRTIRRRMGLQD